MFLGRLNFEAPLKADSKPNAERKLTIDLSPNKRSMRIKHAFPVGHTSKGKTTFNF